METAPQWGLARNPLRPSHMMRRNLMNKRQKKHVLNQINNMLEIYLICLCDLTLPKYRGLLLITFVLALSYIIAFRQRPRNVFTLYEAQPLRCKQCAVRFPENNLGKKKMDEHLDMHFRQNRRVKDTGGRGISRSWFSNIQVCFWLVSVTLTSSK